MPLDRAPYECSGAAVLSWTDPAALAPHDFEQIALQLTGHARAVATDVRHRAISWTRTPARGPWPRLSSPKPNAASVHPTRAPCAVCGTGPGWSAPSTTASGAATA
ncbi:hypothetical protein [Streptomyces sp. BE308]|uniref:hypothetical protein n=1 Tax=Streptomyces sp. BE308 TaxID=3002529 RepID=UPI002E75F2C8|nr:hypothetical protein [Streptomyces sp. BE308]